MLFQSIFYRKKFLLSVLIGVLVLVSVWKWDDRNPMQHVIESAAFKVPAPFAEIIPAGALVYWQNNVQGTWFLLHTASYISTSQVAGVVFNRLTAQECKRRFLKLQDNLNRVSDEKLLAASIKEMRSGYENLLEEPNGLTRTQLVHLCSDPVLDFAILNTQYSELLPSHLK